MLFSTKKQFRILCGLAILVVFSVFTFHFAYAESGVPTIISYQGRLTDSGGNSLGGAGTPYFFRFSFGNSSTVGSGNKVWPSSNPGSTSLTVKQGVFSVNIGDTDNGYPDALDYNFNTNKKVYLQVEISSDNSNFETLSPRSIITSSAFSQVANQVSGVGQSSFGTTTLTANSVVTAVSTGTNSTALSIFGSLGQSVNLFNIFDHARNLIFSIAGDGSVFTNGNITTTKTLFATTTNTSNFTLGLSGPLTSLLGSGLVNLNGALTVSTSTIQNYFSTLGSGLSYNPSTGAFTNTGVTALGGTTNQVNVSNMAGTVTLSLPQNIDTGATPTFASTTLTNFTEGSIPFFGVGGTLSQNNSGLFWDNTNGRLGIGTTTPGSKLHISVPETPSTREKIFNFSMTGLSDPTTIAGFYNGTINSGIFAPAMYGFRNANTNKYVLGNIAFIGSSGDVAGYDPLLYYEGSITNSSSDPFNGTISALSNRNIWGVGSSGSVKMVVGPTGNVGIGTSTPGYALDIQNFGTGVQVLSQIKSASGGFKLGSYGSGWGGFWSSAVTPGVNNYALIAHSSGTALNAPVGGAIQFDIGDVIKMYLTQSGGLNLGYTTTDPGSGNMVISGNLGIGTTTPSVKLHTYTTTAGDSFKIENLQSGGNGGMLTMNVDSLGRTAVNVTSIKATGAQAGAYFNATGFEESWFGVAATKNPTTYRVMRFGNSTNGVVDLTNGTFAIQRLTDNSGAVLATPFQMSNAAPSGSFVINSSGDVGIGVVVPTSQLHTNGTVRFANFGAGTLQTDILGNVIAGVSDERLKNIVDGGFNRGLSDLKNINPILYKWKQETGFDTTSTYAGFSAQNIQLSIPEAVSIDPHGFLSLQDRPILATLVNAVKEVDSKVDNFLSFLTDKTVSVKELIAGVLRVSDRVCVDDVCVTKDQFKQILLNGGGQPGNQIINTVITPTSLLNASSTEVVGSSTTSTTSVESSASVDVVVETTPPVVVSDTPLEPVVNTAVPSSDISSGTTESTMDN